MQPSRLPILKRLVVLLLSLAAYIFLYFIPAGAILTGANISPANIVSSAPSARPDPVPPIVQSSRALISADPRAQYFIIKRTHARLISESEYASSPDQEGFDLHDCGGGSDYLDLPEDDPIRPLADLAYAVIFLRKSLTNLGYPESLWRPSLLQFEEEQITLRLREMGKKYSDTSPSSRHHDAFGRKLARELNSYRRRRAPDLPAVTFGDGCGAGNFGINVRTVPASGRVIFIPVFFHALCKAQQLDPNDPAQCDRWREPAEGVLFTVSGDYFYRAFWPGGAERRGRLSFIDLHDGKTVTFRRP